MAIYPGNHPLSFNRHHPRLTVSRLVQVRAQPSPDSRVGRAVRGPNRFTMLRLLWPTCLAGLCVSLSADSLPELLTRRSTQLPFRRAASGISADGVFSGDGRWVVFSSDAADLVVPDPNGSRMDVFRHELATGKTELVSVPEPSGLPVSMTSYAASVSEDGRRIAFIADKQVGNSSAAAYVRHYPANAGEAPWTELVSGRMGGAETANGEIIGAQISGDGRFVLFESLATDLVAEADGNLNRDIFLRDVENRTTIRLSNRSADGQAGNAISRDPVMNRNASVVVFRSDATDLTGPVTGNATDLYLWSRGNAGLRRILVPGTPLSASQLPVRVMNPVLSPDGRYLAFRTAVSSAGVTALNAVWWFDLNAGTNVNASAGLTVGAAIAADDARGPVMSADGRTIAFDALVGTDAVPKVHLWKADTGLHTLDSLRQTVPPGGGEPVHSESPVLSPDGQKLAFLSRTAIPGTEVTTDGEYRLVVWTLATGQPWLAPLGPDGNGYDLPFPEFSPDSGWLLFQTESPIGSDADENETFDVFLADPAKNSVTLISAAPEAVTTVTPTGFSSIPGQPISADRRHVLLGSFADDLVAGDTNGFRDVFRLDRQTGEMRKVSVGLDGAGPNGHSTPLQISPDARFVLFSSHARNLSTNDVNNFEDLFVTDLANQTTRLVSAKNVGGTSSTAGGTSQGIMSADGTRVLFASTVGDLVTAVTTGTKLYFRDLSLGQTRLVSRNQPEGFFGVEGRVLQFGFAEDGRIAGFVAGSNQARDIYLYDAEADSVRRLTTNQSVVEFALSPDASRLAYVSSLVGLPRQLRVVDVASGTTTAPLSLASSTALDSFQFSRDGRFLVFGSPEAFSADLIGLQDTNGVADIFRMELATGTLRLVSIGADGQLGDGAANQPETSADGSRIVFRSTASNFAAGDANLLADVFLWEASTGRSRLISANPATGQPANGLSTTPAISADGLLLLFVSSAADFVPGDANAAADLFGVSLDPVVGGDTDADGLPDDWERTNFGSLDATAAGDPDGDGRSNHDEFIAGTNPVSAASVFSVTLTGPSVESLVLRWQSRTGVTYVVETATTLDSAAFVATGTVIVGDGLEKSVTLPAGDSAGFLRVRAQR